MQTDTTTAALIRSTAAMLDEAGAMRAARKGRTVERARARRFKSARAFLAIAFA